MVNVKLKDINKVYNNKTHVVHDFNLDIQDQEFVVFVGPSGCGKTTTLRMIAGLEDISAGELWIDGKKVNEVEAKKRHVAMVFQNYALYPHMTVYKNLSFSLENNKVPKEVIEQKVHETAKILGIEEYLERKPKQLSGGQRQRVALGRAIVRDAKVYLMDEPLSNLDAKLRIQMRTELIELHKKIKATTIYVTHDQTEAMTMADKIVVMKDGYIQQVGSPEEVYEKPVNRFVAGFLGSPQINFLEGIFDGKQFLIDGTMNFDIPEFMLASLKEYKGKPLVVGIRPEDIYVEDIVKCTFPSAVFDFKIHVKEMLGHEYILHGDIQGQTLIIRAPLRILDKNTQNLSVAFDLNKIHLFDLDSGGSLL
ncbi:MULTISPECIES: ABC transporter ATP-binding protein [Terrabacteria group]|uniref:ABC transporter ATP-binding protein n=1 Tax=Bacillati TaxID=1783272 RepID=UPI001939C5BC|nr:MULTISPECIES: sn-glycerol-3-phosphate ABC transporter ATP-binding protein UgpC [Terrabacteria group]MBW9212182.1 sn-glycerol-3-phosphate ABC transporter ATP-binding protein UgpC [Trueperella sp. zg.1013]QRG86273.1 sn-glycerol-3-phosphate ABC transporter ATP-binding protein UgpC [Bulleidia sp. zg-1006]